MKMEDGEIRKSGRKDMEQHKMNMVIVYSKYVAKLEHDEIDRNSNVKDWRTINA